MKIAGTKKSTASQLNLSLGLACLLSFVLSAGSVAQNSADRKPLFGELHIHTGWSFDAYVFGVRATPDDAYLFGKGGALKHPLGKTYQMSRPLDFMGVTDHGIFMGVFAKMGDPGHPLSKHSLAERANDPDPAVASGIFTDMLAGKIPLPELRPLINPALLKDSWARTIESANRHNDPGTFTALIGYEWSSMPDGQNMHRNVFFKGDTAPTPFTRLQSQDPAKLWDWMDKEIGRAHV